MLSKSMEKAINEQFNKEVFSAYLYLAMSAYADENGLKGTAHWFMVQYHEEMVHAMKFYEYLQDQGNTVAFDAIEKPAGTYSSALSLFEAVLVHERFITNSINHLMELAIAEKDHATKSFLEWYVTEQVEEEKNANDIIQILKMIGDNTAALYLYDKELSARMVNVPTNFTTGVTAAMSAA